MTMDPKSTRGYRNKNPGNIDHVATNKWQGLADPPLEPKPASGRARFCVFRSHQYGIRALANLLLTYQDRHKLNTPRKIISRWAPGSENNTEAYVRAVCKHGNWDPDEIIDLHTYADLRPMVEAIIKHEIGGMPYTRATIDEALTIAGVPPQGVAHTNTGRAAAGTAVAGIGAASTVQIVTEVAPYTSEFTDLIRTVGPWVVAAIVLAVAGYFLWSRARKQREIAS
jgi:hypothetical protein